MTPVEWKVVGSVAVLLWAWWKSRAAAPAATGTVDVGAPTVTGSGSDRFGGSDYGIASTAPLDQPSVTVQDAIDRSTAIIMANGGYPE